MANEPINAIQGNETGRVSRIYLQLHTLAAENASKEYGHVNATSADADTLRPFGFMLPYNGTNAITGDKDPTASENYALNVNLTAKEKKKIDAGEKLTRSICLYA